MASKARFLEEVFSEYNQSGWLDENHDAVYSTISRMLKSDKTISQGIDMLLLVFPYVLNREDLKRWGKLIKDALAVFRGIEAGKEGTRSSIYVLVQRDKRVRLTRTKRRPRDKVVGFEMLEIYLTLLMGTLYYQSEVLTEQRINEILQFGRTVNDAHMYHKLYQTLALVYNQKQDYDRAIDFARLSYAYWSKREDTDSLIRLEKALTAYAMALAYHGKQELDRSLQWLEQAADLFATVDYPLQHGVISLQRSAIYMWMEDYDTARQWAQLGLEELLPLNAGYHIAVAYHYLGMAQAYTDDPAAFDNLLAAVDIWKAQGNILQQVYTSHTLAYAEARAGRRDEALERLHTGLVLLRTVPENRMVAAKREKIRQLIQSIEKGEDLRTLSPHR